MSVLRTDSRSRRWAAPAPRRRFMAFVLGLALATLITPTPATVLLADAPKLHLADLVPVQESGGAVRWTVGEPSEFDPGNFETAGFLTTNTRTWRLGVRRQVSFRDTGYYLDVYARHRRLDDVYRFKVRAEVEGQFRDCLMLVPFELEETDGDPPRVESGEVEMPIHQPAPTTFVTAEPQIPEGESVWRVDLGEANDLKIVLSNLLNAEVELQPEVVRDPDTWDSLDFVGLPEDGLVHLGSEDKDDLVLRGQPKSLPALLRSMLPREDREGLTINLKPTSLGRRGQRLEIPLVVRYVPSAPLLASVLFLGVLLGCLCRLAFSPQPWKPWLRMLAASLLLSLIVWIVGIGLHAADSRLQLFGFEINPLDIVGVSLIGIAVGFGGKKVVGWVEERFGLRDEPETSSPEPPVELPADSPQGTPTSAEGRA